MKLFLLWVVVPAIASLALQSPVAAAEAGADNRANAQTDVQTGIRAEWNQLFAEGDFAAVMSGYNGYTNIERDEYGVETLEGCRQQSAQLAKDREANPLSIAVSLLSMQCASKLGDDELAEQLNARVAALLEFSFKSTPPDRGVSPIRVLSEADAYSFIEATGGELLYAFYDLGQLPRHLTLRTSVWDPKSQRERQLSFDFLDSMVRLQRGSAVTYYPIYRSVFAESLLEQLDSGVDSAAGASRALNRARMHMERADRVNAIAALAADMNYGAAVSLGKHCFIEMPEDDCAARAVDVLLPYAQEHYADALLMLATGYAMGSGVAKDKDAAQALIKKANARLGGHYGSLRFQALLCQRPNAPCPHPWVQDDFESEVAAGNPIAVMLQVELHAKEVGKFELLPAWIEPLENVAREGLPIAQRMMGVHRVERGEREKGMEWLAKSAEAGDKIASFYLLGQVGGQPAFEQGSEQAQRWLTMAANNGHIDAMGMLARRAAIRPEPESMAPIKQSEWSWAPAHVPAPAAFNDLQWWLQSAYAFDDQRAALFLAGIYESGVEGAEGNAEDAQEIYLDLIGRFGNPTARERLVFGWLRSDPDSRPAAIERAETLLRPAVDAGDVHAKWVLSRALGLGKPEQLASATTLLQEASEAGNKEAMADLGDMYLLGRGVPSDNKKAIALWRASSDEVLRGLNNLAWYQCTVREPELYNPADGMVAAKGLLERAGNQPAYLDTVAACQAATDDFEAAAKTQSEAIAQLEALSGASEAMLEGLRSRLKLYQEDKTYEETIERAK